MQRSTFRTQCYVGAVLASIGLIVAYAAVWQSPKASAVQATTPLPALPMTGTIFQAERTVGFALGAKRDPSDVTRVEFSEITNASRFDFREEFEFQKYFLRIVRVHEVKDAASDESRTLYGVVAKVVGKRS